MDAGRDAGCHGVCTSSGQVCHNAAGMPAARPILSMDGTFENEQVRHLNMIRRAHNGGKGDISIMAPAVVFGRVEGPEPSAAPDTGAHSDGILGWLGLDAAARARLRSAGAI